MGYAQPQSQWQSSPPYQEYDNTQYSQYQNQVNAPFSVSYAHGGYEFAYVNQTHNAGPIQVENYTPETWQPVANHDMYNDRILYPDYTWYYPNQVGWGN